MIRPSWFVVLSAFLGCMVAGQAGASVIRREVRVDPSKLSVRGPDGRQVLSLEGAASALAEGEPDLPVLPVHLAVPEGERVVDVRFIPLESTVLPGRYAPSPVLPPRPETGVAIRPIRDDILGSSAWYPADPVVARKEGRLRGHPLYGVGVTPVQWLPGSGELVLHTRFAVEVTTEPALPADRPLVVRRESPAGAREFGDLFARLTGSPDGDLEAARTAVRPLVNSGLPVEPTFRPSIDGSPVEMVIITAAGQEAAWQQLADFHTQTGITCVVRTVSWIRANYPDGVDVPESIRNFIADAVAQWGTTWVLLGGDTDHIPVRYGFTLFYDGENIPTDLYYSDLDGTWDGDGDGVFGEGWYSASVPGDDLDLYPDVYVGRLPSATLAEAQIMVDKTLTFAETPPAGYTTDVLLLGEVLFPQDYYPGATILYDGASICQDLDAYIPPGHHKIKLYENYPGFPGSLPETKSAVVDSINAGFGIIHHVGHGYINVMSVGLNGETLGNSDADAFVNGGECSLLYAINCTSSAIDFNCIAERFLKNGNGGALAVIGSTRLDFPTTGRSYQNEYYQLLFQDGVTRLGQTFADAKVPFVIFASQDNTHRWTQFTQILLGDPALDFYTADPQPLAMSHPSTYTLGVGTFPVDATLGGAPAESILVTLYKDGDAHGSAWTDVLGHADVPFHPDETGTFSVAVSKHNGLPSIQNASVVAPGASPYLFALDQNINDDTVAPSVGDGDGVVESGETVELGFVLKNNGGATEIGVTATLSSADPYVSISDNLSFYNDIAAGASLSPNDPFVVTISRNAPDRHLARCTLDVFGASGSYSEEVILYVHAPVFNYRLQAVRDSVGNGNNNGTIAANEDFAIIPTLENLGQGSARNLEIRLRSTDPAVTITDSVAVVGALAPGAVYTASGNGLLARLSNVTEYHELRIVLVDAYGEVYSQLVDWTKPDAPTSPVGVGAASSITLSWTPSIATDVRGYDVYRAPSQSGPFSRVNEATTRRIAYFVDDNLPGLTRYYYQIAAVDSSGNQSAKSTTVSATTSLPLHDGWPVEVLSASTAGITLADLNDDGMPEILGGGDEVYAVFANGDEVVNGDSDVRTLGPITDSGLQGFRGTPAVADIDGDGVPEIAAISWNDAKLYIVDANGVPEAGWPRSVNPLNFNMPNPLGSVCLADIDADGDYEVLATVGRCLLAWHHDGTEVIDGDANPATDGVFASTGSTFCYGTPTVANIDEDPYREIIVGMRDSKLYVYRHDGTTYPGFPLVTGDNITSSPAVGDIDGDGRVEIVFGSSDNKVYAIRADKSSVPGYPVGIQLQEDYDSSPALGDLNLDGHPDVVIGASNGSVFAFSGTNGLALSGFPVLIRDSLNNQVPVRSSPVLADVDGDGFLDIVVGDQHGRLHAFSRTGVLLPGFPIQTGNVIENSPAVWDVDNDGLTEVVAESFDQNIYVWDTPWTFNQQLAVWPMFKRNQRNTGVLDEAVFAVTAATDPGGTPKAFLFQNAPNPFHASGTRIRYRIPEGGGFRGVSLRVYDMNGRLIRTLVDGEQPAGIHELSWDGRDDAGRDVASGIYPYRLRVAGEDHVRKMLLVR